MTKKEALNHYENLIKIYKPELGRFAFTADIETNYRNFMILNADENNEQKIYTYKNEKFPFLSDVNIWQGLSHGVSNNVNDIIITEKNTSKTEAKDEKDLGKKIKEKSKQLSQENMKKLNERLIPYRGSLFMEGKNKSGLKKPRTFNPDRAWCVNYIDDTEFNTGIKAKANTKEGYMQNTIKFSEMKFQYSAYFDLINYSPGSELEEAVILKAIKDDAIEEVMEYLNKFYPLDTNQKPDYKPLLKMLKTLHENYEHAVHQSDNPLAYFTNLKVSDRLARPVDAIKYIRSVGYKPISAMAEGKSK